MTRNTRLKSGKSGNFVEILDLGGDRTYSFLHQRLPVNQVIQHATDTALGVGQKRGERIRFFFLLQYSIFLLIRKNDFSIYLCTHSEPVFRNAIKKFWTYYQTFSSDASGKHQVVPCQIFLDWLCHLAGNFQTAPTIFFIFSAYVLFHIL